MKRQGISSSIALVLLLSLLTMLAGNTHAVASAGVLTSDLARAPRFSTTNNFVVTAETVDPFVGDKLSPDLRDLITKNSHFQRKVSVILQSDNSRDRSLRDVLRKTGSVIRSEAKNLNILEVLMPLVSVEIVAQNPHAKHLSLNLKTTSLGHVETTTGVTAMRAIRGNSGIDGKGIGIAILDSGIYSGHDEFYSSSGTNRVVKQVQFETGGAEDFYGHGTHVAALAAGRGG